MWFTIGILIGLGFGVVIGACALALWCCASVESEHLIDF